MDLALLPRRGNHLALDFVNSVDPRYGDERVEYLADYRALVAWSVWAGGVEDGEDLLATADTRAARAVHRRALRLRDDLYALLRPAREPSAVGAISAELRRASAHVVLRPAGSGYEEAFTGDAPDRMLWPIVRSAAALATSPQLERVHECAGTDCGWLFLDTSKAGRRRWCSMEVCGNRAKVQRYRARRG
jgi:predicted RNA-binding Zn ribbon-like protein